MSRIITVEHKGEFTADEFAAVLQRVTKLHEDGHLSLEDCGTISTLAVFGMWLMHYHPASAALAQEVVRLHIESVNAKPENNQ